MPYTYEFPMSPATATGVIVYQNDHGEWEVLLGKRRSDKNENAYPGWWCLPGGFMEAGREQSVTTMRRECLEETGLDITENCWHIVGIDDHPGNDPRYDQVINVCYLTVVNQDEYRSVRAGDDLEEVKWVPMDQASEMKLAFTHNMVLEFGAEKLGWI